MENSFYNNTNSYAPFSDFQARNGGNACASRSSAPTHRAAQRGQPVEPQIAAGPRLGYGQVYISNHSSSNTFRQAPFESQRFGSLHQTAPFVASVPQFQPPHGSNVGGEFPRQSLNVNVNVPPPPVNLNVCPPPPVNVNVPPLPPANINVPPPPPLPVNVNMPRLLPVNRNIAPPGFGPLVPPPPVFSPHRPPPVIASPASADALAHSPLVSISVPLSTSLTSWTDIAGAGGQRLGLPQPPVPSSVSSQRMPSNRTNEPSLGNSVVRHRSFQQSSRGTFSDDSGLSDFSCDHSSSVRISASSSTLASKCANADGVSLTLSAIDDSTHSSIKGTAVSAAVSESESTVSGRRRRRASTKSNITVS